MDDHDSKRSHTENAYSEIVEKIHDLKVDGRYVVELFTEIPSAELYPDYREVVKEPISLAEISKRANLRAYQNDDEFIADFELMVENAKAYNGDDSPVVDDALDILDFVLQQLGRPISATSLQRQQLALLQELINYKSKGRRLSDAFMVEPDPEQYPSYYEIVKDATSFSTVESRISEVPCDTWQQFLELVEPIFTNAQLFNQEGSQIFSDAKTLQRQLHNKVNKRLAPPPKPSVKLRVTRPANTETVSSSENESESEESSSEDDSEEEVVEHRFDDDDDEDFEADPDDFDDEDVPQEDDEDEAAMGHDATRQSLQPQHGIPGMPQMPHGMMGMHPAMPGMMPAQTVPPSIVRDEVVKRLPGHTARDGLIQLVTCNSMCIPERIDGYGQPVAPSPSCSDIVQLRMSASRSNVMTAYATSLASYQSTLQMHVYLHEQLRTRPHSLTVALNGRKLMPVTTDPSLSGFAPFHDEFELRLSTGLNQVTVIAIVGDSTGMVRPVGPPPVVGTESDEERMELWLNLSR